MDEAGVPMLLVGDSAANVVLGYDSTVPISLDLLIELTAAVRRGAPRALLMGDMPFGSYAASAAQGVRNAVRMLKQSGCDWVKLEVSEGHAKLVRRLADAGAAVVAHLGLRPQAVHLMGGYRMQGRTASSADAIVATAVAMQTAGAAGILLEAVPAEVAAAVVRAVDIPVIGCGAGPACHAHVVVTPDAIGLAPGRVAKFVPKLADVRPALVDAYAGYVRQVVTGQYPAPEHVYPMPPDERAKFVASESQATGEDRAAVQPFAR
jgi:3-methyl-2-oxobutanoate hydroxymethyltransferase